MPAIGNILMLAGDHPGGRLGPARQGGGGDGALLRDPAHGPAGARRRRRRLGHGAGGAGLRARLLAGGAVRDRGLRLQPRARRHQPRHAAAHGRLHRRPGDHRRRPPDPDAGRAGHPALLGRRGSTRRSPIPWSCRDERGRSGGEKVFDPTPQKLAEARRKGDIPRSTDVTAAATYLALLAVVGTAGAFALDQRRLGADGLHRPAGPAGRAHPRAGRAAALRLDPDRGAGGAGAVLPGADRGGAGQPLRPAGDHLLRRQDRAQARRGSRSSPTPSASSAPPGSSSSPRRRSSSPPWPSRSSSTSRATSTG